MSDTTSAEIWGRLAALEDVAAAMVAIHIPRGQIELEARQRHDLARMAIAPAEGVVLLPGSGLDDARAMIVAKHRTTVAIYEAALRELDRTAGQMISETAS